MGRHTADTRWQLVSARVRFRATEYDVGFPPLNLLQEADTVKIIFKIAVKPARAEPKIEVVRQGAPHWESLQLALVQDVAELLQSKQHADVKLKVGKLQVVEKTFEAHKAILAARSPVFAKMFDEKSGF